MLLSIGFIFARHPFLGEYSCDVPDFFVGACVVTAVDARVNVAANFAFAFALVFYVGAEAIVVVATFYVWATATDVAAFLVV
jgi:hypothetical protein